MSDEAVWRKLFEAVLGLACGSAPRRERLECAVNLLVFLPREAFDDGEEWRSFEGLMLPFRSTLRPPDSTGGIAAAIEDMDDVGVRKATEEIVSFYDTFLRSRGPLAD